MNTFNMKQWLQENKVGPYSKTRLNEDDSSVPDMPMDDKSQEMPIGEAKYSPIAYDAAEMLMRDINDRKVKTYSKEELDRVFDTLEDKNGEHYDNSDFQDAIYLLKQRGHTMTFGEETSVGYVAKVRPSDPQSDRF